MSGSWKISPHPVACRSQTQLLGAEAVQVGGSFYHVCPCLAWLPAFATATAWLQAASFYNYTGTSQEWLFLVPVSDPSALWVLTHENLGSSSYLRRRSQQALQMLHPPHQSKQNAKVLNFCRFRTSPVVFFVSSLAPATST